MKFFVAALAAANLKHRNFKVATKMHKKHKKAHFPPEADPPLVEFIAFVNPWPVAGQACAFLWLFF